MKIKIIAPSACVDRDAIYLAQQQLENLNIETVLSENIFAQHRYLAGTIEQRLGDLKQACIDQNIDAIWCGRGGTGAAQLLPYLDQWILNKPLIGYSDSTVLLNYIAMQGGEALHAPVFQEIATKNLSQSMKISNNAQEVIDLLHPNSQQKNSIYPIQALNLYAKQFDHAINTTILGGNLATLCSLQGTPWAVQCNQPSIVLIEDVGEAFYRLERLLVQILQSIQINHLQAVILGDFYNCPQKNVPHSIAEIFSEHLNPLKIPLFSADWFGHGQHNRPFWIGKQGILNNHQLSI